MSGTKTSQSEVDNGVVVVDGKVKTPKEYISINKGSLRKNISNTLNNI
jgi:hypothetical protein